MALQIVGAALPRTGTLSLKFALEMLGFARCYHMSELILHPEHRWRWTFARARPGLLDPLWAEYHATLDAPSCALWKQLAKRFPQAKVILTRRDPVRWYESVMETVGSAEHVRFMLRSSLAPAALANPPFGLRLERQAMVRHFERYGDEVRKTIAPDRLLEFEAKDGWEPLCRFLGMPVPDQPFPHVNDRDAMNAAAEGMDFARLTFADVQQATRRFIDAQRQSLLSR
ncbi:sulfotransferase [Qipengyuania sp. G39]|uniref:Sulfotransferase n=1 Tax=Qipengyuania profundimaris TaxID=3067652 RepID=A0ABT9HQJ1_9SPHN|nr:sulfotransferase family protein [Qipengyuania sp. G39]MDP4575408.1 sulfotransferase [Qipengyuania sp. G39]